MKLLPGILLTCFFFCSVFANAQQDYYWVGGSGNWSDLSHWATTSGGTTMHTVIPTTDDNVYFDSESFTGSGQSVTIDVEANCHDFIWSGINHFPAVNASAYLYISGTAALNTDTDYNFDRVYFTSDDVGETITTEGSSFGSSCRVFFDGTGEYTFAGSLDADYFYFYKGTYITNNFNITASSYVYFNSQSGTLLDISLGSSTIETSRFTNQSASDLVLDAGTSTFLVQTFRGDSNGNGPFTYHNISFDRSGLIFNDNIFNTIAVDPGMKLSIESGTTQTLVSLDVDGTKYSTTKIDSRTEGAEATLNATTGTVSTDYVGLQDIHATGGATFSATNAIDKGNNTGWSITAPTGTDYYWVGDGGNWSDPTHWATASGGTTKHTDYPGIFDDVFFDANSFTQPDQTVTIDIQNSSCKNMDWTGVTNQPTISSGYQYNMSIYGSAYFKDGVVTQMNGLGMKGDDAGLEFFYGDGSISYLRFSGTGAYTMLDDIDCAGFYVYGGTVNLGSINLNSSYRINLQNDDDVVLNMQDANIATDDVTQYGSTPVTINPGNSTLTVSGNLDVKGHTFNKVVLTGTGKVTGSNTFDTLEIHPGAMTTFDEAATQTISTLLLTGEKSSPISLLSSETGTQTTFSVASGTVEAIYLIMQDMAGTGGATFNADQTVDNGNNTGWNITGITPQDYYWVGGSGNWSDYENHWATTSGGTTFHTGLPGVLDNVFFDANSFSSDIDEVVIDLESVSMKDLEMTGMDDQAAISGNKVINIYGSLNLSPIAKFYPKEFHFLSNETETISANSSYLGSAEFNFDGSGSWTLTDSLEIRDLNIADGTFNTGGQYVYISFQTYLFGTTGILVDLDTSTFFTRSFNHGNASNFTVSASEATVIFSSQFRVGSEANDVTLDDIIIRQVNSTDKGRLMGNLSVDSLTVEAGSAITVEAGKTVTASQITMNGTSEAPIILQSSSEGEAGTLSQPTGTVDATFLEIKDNIATGGATFNAEGSLSLGNVSGWTFFKTEQSIDFSALEDKFFSDEPFELAATATSGLDVVFEILSGPATVEGNLMTLDGSTGTVQVKATQPGDIQYFAASSVINEFEVTGYTQEITHEPLGLLTYGDEPATITAASTQDLVLEFTSSDESVGTVSEGAFSITGAGETTITISQPGNDTINSAVPVGFVVTVDKASLILTADDQTITYGSALPDLTYSISGLAYEDTDAVIETGPAISTTASVSSDAGTYPIEISSATAAHYGISYIDGTLTVDQAEQTITFDPQAEIDITEGSLLLEATASSGLQVSFSLVSGPATLDENTLTFTGTGEVLVKASQTGDLNYLAAEITQAILIVDASKTDQTITFEEITDRVYGDSFEVTASASSGLPVVLSVESGPASITGTTVAITGAGEVSIRASQTGDNTYNPAASVTRAFTANKSDLTITAGHKSKTYGEVNPDLSMTFEGWVGEDDESAITLPAITTTASIESNAGEYPIVLSGGESANYNLLLVDGVLTVNKAIAVVTFAELDQGADGTGKSPTITTDPTGLDLIVTFDGLEDLPVEAGSYEVVANIADANYEGDGSATFTLTSIVASSGKQLSISVHPNPATKEILISGVENAEATFYDFHGKVIYQSSVDAALEVSHLAEGTYVLLLRDHKQEIIHRSKMIIIH